MRGVVTTISCAVGDGMRTRCAVSMPGHPHRGRQDVGLACHDREPSPKNPSSAPRPAVEPSISSTRTVPWPSPEEAAGSVPSYRSVRRPPISNVTSASGRPLSRSACPASAVTPAGACRGGNLLHGESRPRAPWGGRSSVGVRRIGGVRRRSPCETPTRRRAGSRPHSSARFEV